MICICFALVKLLKQICDSESTLTTLFVLFLLQFSFNCLIYTPTFAFSFCIGANFQHLSSLALTQKCTWHLANATRKFKNTHTNTREWHVRFNANIQCVRTHISNLHTHTHAYNSHGICIWKYSFKYANGSKNARCEASKVILCGILYANIHFLPYAVKWALCVCMCVSMCVCGGVWLAVSGLSWLKQQS